MKIRTVEYLHRAGTFAASEAWDLVLGEILAAIQKIQWPRGAEGFFFRGDSVGRGRGEGNGVTPIKGAFILHLQSLGWEPEVCIDIATVKTPGALDAVKELPGHGACAVEWETGNVSSSHRALNKMALGLLSGKLCAGVLVVPTREMYRFLTDRIGNFPEIEPYFPMWKALPVENGVLAVIAIEHDGVRPDAPRIEKGTDGWALA